MRRYLLTPLLAWRTALALTSLSSTSGIWTISLSRVDGQQVTVRLSARLAVGAGGVAFGSEASAALHSGVQCMQMRPQGPVWDPLGPWATTFLRMDLKPVPERGDVRASTFSLKKEY